MEFKQLLTFQTAAEKLNFTHTAEALNFAQSSVTAHIKSLEEELGIHLFDRLGKRIILTDAGQTLKTYADKILSLTEEARMAVRAGKEPSGTLVIGASESLCTYRLPPVLSRFRRLFPKVQFRFSPGISDKDIYHQLEKGQLDAAILMDVNPVPEAFIIERLNKEPITVVAAPDYGLFDKRSITPADLYHESLLLTEKGCRYRQLFDHTFIASGLHPSQVFEFSSVEAMKQCVIAGLGVAVLPRMTIQKELENGLIKELPWQDGPMYVHSHLVWHKNKWISPALAAFLKLTRQTLKKQAVL